MHLRDMEPKRVTSVILAGGMSRRMGRDKALIPDDDGVPWLSKIADVVSPISEEVLISTGPMIRYRELRLPRNSVLIPDEICGVGPLGGILTALHVTSTPYLLCLTCDMPDIMLETIYALPLPEEGAVYSGETFFPILFRRSEEVTEELKRQIETGDFAVKTFLRTIQSRPMKFHSPLRNINLPLEI